MAIFLEGVSVVVQPCTLVIAFPTFALALVARHHAAEVVAASVIATATMMWARAAGHWTFASTGFAAVVIATLITIGFALVRRRGSRSSAIAGAIVSGSVAGWLWQPCVGEELGEILNRASADRPGTLVMMVIYTGGALLPMVVLAALPHAWPAVRPRLFGPWPERAGLAFGAIYALAVLSGQYGDLIGELSRWSSA